MDALIPREKWNNCLERKCETLVDYLQIEDGTLVHGCLSKGIINHRQEAYIMAGQTHYDKAGRFRDVLLRINMDHYMPFLRLLHKHQPDLACELADHLGFREYLDSQQPKQEHNESRQKFPNTTSRQGILSASNSKVPEVQLPEVQLPEVQTENERKEKLIKIIINMEKWQDVECNGLQTLDLLENTNIMEPIRKPSLFIRMIRKAEDLIESGLYVSIVKAMVSQYKECQSRAEEDPLLCLIEELERYFPSTLTNHHDNFLELIKTLLMLDSSSDTRSRCMRILIMRTREWKLSKGEQFQEMKSTINKQLQWDYDFIEVLKDLMKKGADPNWTPVDLMEGSNLHLVTKTFHHTIACKSHLFTNLMALLNIMMTDSSTNCTNVTVYGQTVLHALVDGKSKHVRTDCAEQISEFARQLRMRNPALLDHVDAFKNSPLHAFVFDVFQKHKDNLTSEIIKFVNSVVPVLKSDANVNFLTETGSNLIQEVVKKMSPYHSAEVKEHLFQLMQNLKSDSNINVNRKGLTVLHTLAANAEAWANSPEFFLRLVENLSSSSNINVKDPKGRTALFIFTSMANHWKEQGEIFLEVLKCLISSCNIDFQAVHGQTPLHLFVSMGIYWDDHPSTFLEVIKLLRSPLNFDFRNDDGHTAIHSFVASRSDWAVHKETFTEVVKVLRSTSNVDFKDINKQSPLHLFISTGNHWSQQIGTFLEIVKFLRSPSNIDFRDKTGQTTLHLFISMALFWSEDKQIFLEIVKCLRSPLNLDYRNQFGQTPLLLFTSVKLFQEETSETAQEVVKCLSSSL